MGECKDGHIPTCMVDNKLSHTLEFWPPLFHMEEHGQEMFQGIGGRFIDVGELYFASPDQPVHESVPLVRSFPKGHCPSISCFTFLMGIKLCFLNNLIIVKIWDLK